MNILIECQFAVPVWKVAADMAVVSSIWWQFLQRFDLNILKLWYSCLEIFTDSVWLKLQNIGTVKIFQQAQTVGLLGCRHDNGGPSIWWEFSLKFAPKLIICRQATIKIWLVIFSMKKCLYGTQANIPKGHPNIINSNN